jgi:transposase
MVRPISNDLRKRAVSAVVKGESCRSVAERFGVAVSSVVKWSQRYRTTGSVAPGKMGGHPKPVIRRGRARHSRSEERSSYRRWLGHEITSSGQEAVTLLRMTSKFVRS